MPKVLGVFLLLIAALTAGPAFGGPYAPEAGRPGSKAVFKDDPNIRAWAGEYEAYSPGEDVFTKWQTPQKALGPAKGDSYDVVSLGRGGSIVLVPEVPFEDGPGWDLTVFENGFDGTFLEFAYVEVSSDGRVFYRFPAQSLIAQPVSAFGRTDPTNVHNLAGKYMQGWGTPFDLADVAGTGVDVSQVTHVRLVDVVGDGTALDSAGRIIYDPYPTKESTGFDLDALGIRYRSGMNDVPVEYTPPDFVPSGSDSAGSGGGCTTDAGHGNSVILIVLIAAAVLHCLLRKRRS